MCASATTVSGHYYLLHDNKVLGICMLITKYFLLRSSPSAPVAFLVREIVTQVSSVYAHSFSIAEAPNIFPDNFLIAEAGPTVSPAQTELKSQEDDTKLKKSFPHNFSMSEIKTIRRPGKVNPIQVVQEQGHDYVV